MSSDVITPTPLLDLDPNGVDDASTWAARNPQKDIIPPRKNPQPKKSAAAKALAQKNRDEKRAKNDAMMFDVNALWNVIRQGIKDIATTHKRKEKDIEQLVLDKSRFKKRRAPNIRNALVAAKARELNDGERPSFNSKPRSSTYSDFGRASTGRKALSRRDSENRR